jgi:PleD family two-component response regulator
MEFISNNYQWIFSGIGVALIGWLIFFRFNRKKKETQNTLKNTSTNSNANTNSNTSSITINNNVGSSANEPETGQNQSQNKANCHILFIDDRHSEFKMVSILESAGWVNTRAIKDLSDLDDHKVLEANIIFVDINGVGIQMDFNDQGLGLAAALKEKHPNKAVILYSADPTGDRFNKKLKIVDESLAKNAEPYEFISMIEQYSQK